MTPPPQGGRQVLALPLGPLRASGTLFSGRPNRQVRRWHDEVVTERAVLQGGSQRGRCVPVARVQRPTEPAGETRGWAPPSSPTAWRDGGGQNPTRAGRLLRGAKSFIAPPPGSGRSFRTGRGRSSAPGGSGPGRSCSPRTGWTPRSARGAVWPGGVSWIFLSRASWATELRVISPFFSMSCKSPVTVERRTEKWACRSRWNTSLPWFSYR